MGISAEETQPAIQLPRPPAQPGRPAAAGGRPDPNAKTIEVDPDLD